MDTGRAGTIGAMNLDSVLGKSFFAHHGLLPRGFKKEGLHSWPARDYSHYSMGGSSLDRGAYLEVSPGSWGCVGWNFGADYSRALFIVSGVVTESFRAMLILNDGQPTDESVASVKSLYALSETFSGNFQLGKMDTTGFISGFGLSNLATAPSTEYNPGGANIRHSHSLAVYYDSSGGGTLKMFMRSSQAFAQWIELLSVSSSWMSKVRCATLFVHEQFTSQAFHGSMGIYAE